MLACLFPFCLFGWVLVRLLACSCMFVCVLSRVWLLACCSAHHALACLDRGRASVGAVERETNPGTCVLLLLACLLACCSASPPCLALPCPDRGRASPLESCWLKNSRARVFAIACVPIYVLAEKKAGHVWLFACLCPCSRAVAQTRLSLPGRR